MRITVDRDRCRSLGNCESIASAYFQVNEEGTLDLRQEHPADADLDPVRHAVSGCPSGALSLTDD